MESYFRSPKLLLKIFCVGLSTLFFIFFTADYPYAAYQEDVQKIRVNSITPLHKKSKEAIFSLRKLNVDEHTELGIFPANYSPSSSVFGSIDENADWVSDVQFFIFNPYLLVLTSAGETINPLLPFCNVKSVRYSDRKIEVFYRGESSRMWFYYIYDYYQGNNGIVRLWLVNAYDAGFKYAYIDRTKSVNIDMGWPSAGDSIIRDVYRGHEFFHVGHLGKNNISYNDGRYKVRIAKRDTRTVIYIKLWRNRPIDKNSREDFSYVIIMEP